MKIISGNILRITEGVIAHQVNCRKVAGAGLALQIRNKYPHWYTQYLSNRATLGTCNFTMVAPGLWIANIYGQEGFGGGRIHTDYYAVRTALRLLRRHRPKNRPVYIPYGMGAGLANGDWATVYGIIREEVPFATLVKLEASNGNPTQTLRQPKYTGTGIFE